MSTAADSQRTVRQTDFSGPPSLTQQAPAQSNQQSTFGGSDIVDSPSAAQQTELQPLSQMSEIDKYGLAGLLGMIRHQSQDIANLAIGHDLTSLGLDLNQTEPLHPQFATPFTPSAPTRPLETDYSVPQCYTVANVLPLHQRINGFSEETLFYIFYSMPRDIMQELVAEELNGRKWRFHKVEKMWVTRDESYPNPIEVERGVSEQGTYLWWDWNGWKRVRRPYILRYEDLDDRQNRTIGQVAGFNAMPGGAPQGLGRGL